MKKKKKKIEKRKKKKNKKKNNIVNVDELLKGINLQALNYHSKYEEIEEDKNVKSTKNENREQNQKLEESLKSVSKLVSSKSNNETWKKDSIKKIAKKDKQQNEDLEKNENYNDIYSRLVIQVLYGLGDENEKLKDGEDEIVINIKVSGTDISESEGKFGTQENLAPIPYVIDLLKIREKKLAQIDYVSKVLLYSNTREMEMFYIDNDSPAPVSLFTGNIMLVYTNPELVRQKYHNATTMILITDALYATERTPIGEKYRFMVKFFNSAAQIQYFVSSNPDGRPLNNPTTIEMTSCDQPYYYILNYNQLEGNRKLHIDTIFGERESIKLATVLNQEDWDSLILQMEQFNGDEILLEEQDRFHFDVIEVKCKLPLLLNLFYIDPTDIKTSNLEIGDITIISLEKGKEQVLSFKTGGKGPFVYSFTIMKPNNQNPNIEIEFNTANIKSYNKNGVYSEYSFTEYERIIIRNKEDSGSTCIFNTYIFFNS